MTSSCFQIEAAHCYHKLADQMQFVDQLGMREGDLIHLQFENQAPKWCT